MVDREDDGSDSLEIDSPPIPLKMEPDISPFRAHAPPQHRGQNGILPRLLSPRAPERPLSKEAHPDLRGVPKSRGGQRRRRTAVQLDAESQEADLQRGQRGKPERARRTKGPAPPDLTFSFFPPRSSSTTRR